MVIFHSFLYVYQRVPDVKLGYVKEAQSCTGGDPWELQVGIIGYDHSIWFVCRCVCVRIYIYMYIYIYTRIYRHTETYTDIHIKYANIYMIISYHIILHIQIYAHIYSNMFPYILIICIYIYMTLRCIAFLLLRCVSTVFCNGRWELEVSWRPGRSFSWSSLSGHPWPWGLVLGVLRLETLVDSVDSGKRHETTTADIQ